MLLALSFSFQQLSALQVSGLYSYTIAVLNQSNSERSRAYSDALAAVIVKVTGEQRWLLDPAVIRAIGSAESYVEGVSYFSEFLDTDPVELSEDAQIAEQKNSEPSVLEPSLEDVGLTGETVVTAVAPVEQRFINVDFSASRINELLLEAKIPVWDSNRPSVLIWMTLQDEAGGRTLLNAETNSELVGLIRDFAAERGLPIIFPVLDFEDRRNVSEDTVWSLDEAAIIQASERYGADSILSGRLHFTAGGDLVGVWQFIFQDQTQMFDAVDQELRSYLHAPLDKITSQLASYFAIVPETSDFQVVGLRIDGVGTLQAYAALMSYVNGLGLVESVTTKALDGERLELSLSLLGDPTQLAELIALDRDLRPIESSNLENGLQLHYRWTR